MEVICGNVIPGDSRLVEQLVSELKSQGIFDQFRRECISDVDTKPAYQNLRQRVEGSVATFLKEQTWNIELNKNQLREQLRKNLQESGFLEPGVERIVDQVVNPKINTVFLPKVEEVVYKFLGIENPNKNVKRESKEVSITDLLPTDLEAVSPESVHSFKTESKKTDSEILNNSIGSDSKVEEDESPPFEPLETKENGPEKMIIDENTRDSHLSGFSALESHESNIGSDNRVFQMDLSNQDSQVSQNSSESHLSIVTSEDNSKMDISEDSNTVLKIEKSEPISEDVEMVSLNNESVDKESSKLEKTSDTRSDSSRAHDKYQADEKNDKKLERNDDKKSKSNEKSSKDKKDDRKDDKYRKSSSSSSKDKDKSYSKYSSSSKDRDKKDSKSSSYKDKDKSKDRTDKDKNDKNKSSKYKEKSEKEKSKSDKEKTDKDKIKSDKTKPEKESANKAEKEKAEKEKSEKSKDEKSKSKTDKYKSDKDKSKYEKDKSNKDRERSDKDKGSKEKDKYKDKSYKSKEKPDKEKEKNSKEKSSRDRSNSSKEPKDKKEDSKEINKDIKDKPRDDNKESSKDKSRSSSGSSKHSSSKDKKPPSTPKKESSSQKEKTSPGDSKSKLSIEKYKRDEGADKNSSSNKKDKHESKKKSKDDHYSSKIKKTDRRSTDRDSNDGQPSKTLFNAYSESTSSKSENNSQDYSSSSFTGGSGESGNSDQMDTNNKESNSPTEEIVEATTIKEVPKVKYIKPKFALNFEEARKIMKIRKQLAMLERQNQLSLAKIDLPFENGVVLGESIRDETDGNNKKAANFNHIEEVKKLDMIDEKENINTSKSVDIISQEVIDETGSIIMNRDVYDAKNMITSIESTDISKENWEALEAKLAQVMAEVNYNSYDSDEDFEFYGYSSVDTVPKHLLDISRDLVKKTEQEILFNENKSTSLKNTINLKATQVNNSYVATIDEECVLEDNSLSNTFDKSTNRLKTEDNLSYNQIKENIQDSPPSSCEKTYTRDILKANVSNKQLSEALNDQECCFLEKPSHYEENFLHYLKIAVSKMEIDVEKFTESLGNNIWPTKRGKKRKLEEHVDIKNNNKSSYFETVKKRRGSASSVTVTPMANKKRMSNSTDISPAEHFSLPLSPAESDKSNERKDEDLLIPIKQKRIVRGYSQRYSSDDLYKPRPAIGGRRKKLS